MRYIMRKIFLLLSAMTFLVFSSYLYADNSKATADPFSEENDIEE